MNLTTTFHYFIHVLHFVLLQMQSDRSNEAYGVAHCITHGYSFRCIGVQVMTQVDLKRCKITARRIEEIAPIFSDELESLDLSHNSIGAKGVAELLVQNRDSFGCLKTLSLNASGLGNRGAAIVADFIAGSKTISKLELDYNGIGFKGVRKIAEALMINTSLTELNLNHNLFHRGIKYLATALKRNTTLTCLHLVADNTTNTCQEYGDWPKLYLEELLTALEYNTTLTKLYLDSQYDCETFSLLVKSLIHNHTVDFDIAKIRPSKQGQRILNIDTISNTAISNINKEIAQYRPHKQFDDWATWGEADESRSIAKRVFDDVIDYPCRFSFLSCDTVYSFPALIRYMREPYERVAEIFALLLRSSVWSDVPTELIVRIIALSTISEQSIDFIPVTWGPNYNWMIYKLSEKDIWKYLKYKNLINDF